MAATRTQDRDLPAGAILSDLRRQQKHMEEDMRRLQIDLEAALTPMQGRSLSRSGDAASASPLPTTPLLRSGNAGRAAGLNITSPLRIVPDKHDDSAAVASTPIPSALKSPKSASMKPNRPSVFLMEDVDRAERATSPTRKGGDAAVSFSASPTDRVFRDPVEPPPSASPIARLETVDAHPHPIPGKRLSYGGLFAGRGSYSPAVQSQSPAVAVHTPVGGGPETPGGRDWKHPSVAAAEASPGSELLAYELPSSRRPARRRWDISTAVPSFCPGKNIEAERPSPLYTGTRPRNRSEAPASPFVVASPGSWGGHGATTPPSTQKRTRKRSVSARAGRAAAARPRQQCVRAAVRSRTPDMDLLSKPSKYFDPSIMGTGDLVSQGSLAAGAAGVVPVTRNPLMGEIKPVLTKGGLWATVPYTMKKISKDCGITR